MTNWDAFNVVRTQLLQQTRPKKLNTIMVTSPGRSEGKTTVATNLAITISRDASQTALLVDANLRWPGISCGLGMGNRPSRRQIGRASEYTLSLHDALPICRRGH